MRKHTDLTTVSNTDLLRRLSHLVGQSRHLEADLVAHIAEVERRRLYAHESTSSMFAYCREILHLSEHEAYLRIAAGRAARRHPVLLEMLRDGRLHLTAISLLSASLDAADATQREKILRAATHKSKREIQELVARLEPRPDAPATIRKQPDRRDGRTPRIQLGPDRVIASQPSAPPTLQAGGETIASPTRAAAPDRADSPSQAPEGSAVATPTARPADRTQVQPIAPARYKVTFTVSAELRDKLERLRQLTQSSGHGGDLVAIIDEAVTEKLQRVESRRSGKTTAPRKDLADTDVSSGSRYIPAAVRREVTKRDGDRCTFVNAAGKRCSERAGLEFHHDKPFAVGGDRSPANIRLLCRTHNGVLAEATYGRDLIDRYRRPTSQPPPSPPFANAPLSG